MTRCSIEPRTKYPKGYEFVSFVKNLYNKHRKKIMNTAINSGLDAVKTASKKLVHKAAEAIGEFIGNKNADKIVKSKPMYDINSRNVEE